MASVGGRRYVVILERPSGERREFLAHGNIRKTAIRDARGQLERETGIAEFTRVVSVAPTEPPR